MHKGLAENLRTVPRSFKHHHWDQHRRTECKLQPGNQKREVGRGSHQEAVNRTSTPQTEVRQTSTPMASHKGLSVSAPAAKPDNTTVAPKCDKSSRSLPGFPSGLEPVGTLLDRIAPIGVAAPTGRSSCCLVAHRWARMIPGDAPGASLGSSMTGRAKTPQVARAGWEEAPKQQTSARSATGSLAAGRAQGIGDRR